jgi:hypothetical protein
MLTKMAFDPDLIDQGLTRISAWIACVRHILPMARLVGAGCGATKESIFSAECTFPLLWIESY